MTAVTKTLSALHKEFESIMPIILRQARFSVRSIYNRQEREDRIQEVLAYAWKWYRLLASRGEDGRNFPAVIGHYSCLHVGSGRFIAGRSKRRDVLSSFSGHPGKVEQLRTHGPDTDKQEAIRDDRQSSVPIQVAMRIDFPAWLASLTDRDRNLVECMCRREKTADLARQFKLSVLQVCRLRREFQSLWQQFHQDLPKQTQPAAAIAA